MIRLLAYSEIDFEKYDDCVMNGSSPVLYAESWYLDIATNKNWKVLVWDDYLAVMPVPYGRMKRSFWKNSVVQPYLCQQLGVFSKNEISEEIFDEFVNALTKLDPVVYHFNYTNAQFLDRNRQVKFRTNFILDLSPEYDILFSDFTRSKRNTVRKAGKNDLKITDSYNIDLFLQLQNKYMGFRENPKIIEQKRKLGELSVKKGRGKIYFVSDSSENIIAGAFFILSPQRIYYLQSFSDEKGRELLAMDALMNFVIQKYASADFILDFEGSENPGIAKFMSAFGAQKQNFPVLEG